MSLRRAGVALLLALGLVRMAADLAGLRPIQAVAAATGASPAPKVFSAVEGLETYSTRFTLEWRSRDGGDRELPLTPEAYSRLRGPYNRRNVFGAVVAYGPVLRADARTRPMFDAVAAYALCGERPLLRELGVDPAAIEGPVRLRLDPIAAGGAAPRPWALEVPCR